jgi:fatty-acid desaturase
MSEQNPYEPPKAPVRDAPESPPTGLPRFVRVLRACAVIGSALLIVFSALLLIIGMQRGLSIVVFTSAQILLGGVSIVALTSRNAGNRAYWSAMAVNALVVVMINLTGQGGLMFIVPALLNMVAIEALRRARAQLARA